MNRRKVIASALLLTSLIKNEGCQKYDKATTSSTAGMQVPPSLEPYSGEWTHDTAAHLLRRATFGPTRLQISDSVEKGMQATIEQLFQPLPLPPPPLNYFFTQDPNVPVGATWVNAPYLQDVFFEQYRKKSIRAWYMSQIWAEGVSVRQQLTLFWHNHFGISDIIEHKQEYIHLNLLQTYAWGNFKELVKKVTIDPAMLRFLNGRDNVAGAPNENYARELLELFTVGKGALAGPGDYTTFTEQDVAEIARALTGWRDTGYYTLNANEPISVKFEEQAHDKGIKQLSERFNKELIHNSENLEYEKVIDVIFEQPATALHICRKLYRWFVHYRLNETVEQKVIAPMAAMLRENNYEIRPVLEALFRSSHFYQIAATGPKIKSPVEFLMGALKQLEISMPEEVVERYQICHYLFETAANMQMELLKPPGVAGWKAYYQAPQYYRCWINAATLQYRKQFIAMLTSGLGIAAPENQGAVVAVSPIKILKMFANSHNAGALVNNLSDLLFLHPPATKLQLQLKALLLDGLPDEEWSKNCLAFLENPENKMLANATGKRLRRLLSGMLNMPEFHLI